MSEGTSGSPGGERWLPVVGYEGMYEVSDQGRVQSFKRRPEGVLIGASKDSTGRRKVHLRRENSGVDRVISRVMAEAFLGPPPFEGAVVRHLNDDPTDDRLSNLAWGSRADNSRDAVINKKQWNAAKTECARGHLLVDFNRLGAAQGRRSCRSCQRARQSLKHIPDCGYSLLEISNAEFRRLAAGEGGTVLLDDLMERYG